MKLLYMNDPALRVVCEVVKQEELDYIKSQVPEMTTIMNQEGGIGLAANQVGILKRFFIMKDRATPDKIWVIINPEVIEVGPTETFEEGCLSIPGTSAPTQRHKAIRIRFMDENWQEQALAFNDLESVAVQHEIDHLDGRLYVDQLKPLRKSMVLEKHRKYVKMLRRQ